MIAPVTDSAASEAALEEEPFRVRDLGALLIEVGGVETAVRWRKPARILAVLVVNANRRVSVDTLLDVVWGGKVGPSTAGTLETHVWRLRKLIEPDRPSRVEPNYLVNDSGGYRLAVNPDNVDSLRFAELAGQGNQFLASGEASRALRRYELALQLWRGRPFDVLADDDWATASIARLDELYGQVSEQRVEALLRTGAPERAIGILEGLTVDLPFREQLWSQLMRALYQVGRVEEALGAYQRARESLLDNLGLDPGPGLRDLQQRILDQDPTVARQSLSDLASVSVPSAAVPEPADTGSSTSNDSLETPQPTEDRHEVHLPVLRSELIGRDAELTSLTKLVRRTRLTTLVGAGGAGKTRLAVEVARAAANLASDGVWFVDLAAVDDAESVPEVVLSTIGVAEATVGTPLTALRSYVRDRQVLLLIDNCEHLLDAVRRLIDALLDEDSQARIIATSREPIGVDGEVLWTLAPLAVLDDADDTIGREGELSPAARLFVSKAKSVDATFEVTDAVAADIEAICSAVDGIPLAIELAAGRIRSASLAEVREQVTTALGGLARVGYARTEHHRTVELSIDWSVRLLSDAERAAHARLSVLPGAFTVDVARVVLDAEPTRVHRTADLLGLLVHRSLLFVMPDTASGRPTRFRQLATVRAHAAAALADGGERDEVRQRRRRWADDLVAARPALDAADTDGWFQRVDDDHDTLKAVLRRALVEEADPTGVKLLGQLANYWMYRRRMAEGERWSIAALHLSGVAEGGDLALVELNLAILHAFRDRADRAVPLLRSAIAKSDQVDRRAYTQHLAIAAWAAFLRGDPALDFVDREVFHGTDGDPESQLWGDLLIIRTAFAVDGPGAVYDRVKALATRAVELGNICLASLAASLAASCAMLGGDAVNGSSWLGRATEYQHAAGNVRDVGMFEFEANLAAMVGEHERAARTFALASTLSFREGSPWPLRHWTEATLARVRQELPVDRFETAWRDGVALADAGLDAVSPAPDQH